MVFEPVRSQKQEGLPSDGLFEIDVPSERLWDY
jgi:hypothetical protein